MSDHDEDVELVRMSVLGCYDCPHTDSCEVWCANEGEVWPCVIALDRILARLEAAEAERDALLAEHEAYKHILEIDGAAKHCAAHIHARRVLRGEDE